VAATETLDFALKERLRAVIADHTVTEATLRKVTEQGRACALILDARLERLQRGLVELSTDAESSLADIAAAMRAVSELRPDLEELHALLDDLDAHARELRASWLAVR
jgi:DNA repair exonuclease SbcCD ATPase subunit